MLTFTDITSPMTLNPPRAVTYSPMGAFHRSAMVVGVVATLKGGSGCSGGATDNSKS